jgi:hypothetical protein
MSEPLDLWSTSGPTDGPARWRDGAHSIGVTDSPESTTHIGQADPRTWRQDPRGGSPMVCYQLRVERVTIEGLFLLIGRRFVPTE